jgi:hypothetical protein
MISITVQLTDEQFQALLGRLAFVGPNLTAFIALPPLRSNPDNSSLDSSFYGSYRDYRSRFYKQRLSSLQASKRLLKHEDSSKLDDSASLTYTA